MLQKVSLEVVVRGQVPALPLTVSWGSLSSSLGLVSPLVRGRFGQKKCGQLFQL